MINPDQCLAVILRSDTDEAGVMRQALAVQDIFTLSKTDFMKSFTASG